MFYQNSLKPVQRESEEVTFTLERGCYAKCALEKLEEEGLIRNSTTAYIYAKQSGYTDLKSGDYILDKSMSVEELLKTLSDPSAALVEQVSVTITEGKWASEIAEILANALVNVDADTLLELWNSEEYLSSIRSDYKFITDDIFNDELRCKLEGYLFPETYKFNTDSDEKTVTKRLLDQTEKIYEKYESDFQESRFSIHEVFTLASIIQYESGIASDGALIAGIFVNRMDNPTFDGTGGYLQSNVTAQYAYGDRDVNPEIDANKTIKSKFNTYAYPGLPIGPVCNPGEAPIVAALHPEKHDYYFFLYGKDGKIYPAKNYSEHLRNISKYQ